MSTVKIKGNVSGTGSLTIEAPNTNSDLTLSLPAAGGTIASFASLTNNGVAYVNGSGQPTSGSALTFDGTKLSLPTVLAIKGAQNSNLARIAMTRTDASYSINNETDLRFYGQTTDTESPANILHSMNTGGTFVWNQAGVSELMRLTSTGLGIGTSSPAAKLHVTTGATGVQALFAYGSGTPTIAIGNSATNYNLQLGYNVASEYGYIQATAATSVADDIVINPNGGNLGLGVTPSAWGATFKALEVGRAGSGFFSVGTDSLQISNNYYYNGTNYIYSASGYAERYHMVSGEHRWYTAPSGTAGNAISFTQAMTLDASGYLRLNNTDAGNFLFKIKFDGSSQEGIGLQSSYSGAGNMLRFINSAGTTVGLVSTNNTTTTYATSSDYRLKENIQPMTGALAKVAALKPCTYKWKADGSDGEGFIAHELQAVCPDAVTGEKDAVDAEGNPVYQGIDTSFLVATLTAAIQELKAQVDAQAAEIAALKGTV